ncbi:MAG: aminotransferase class V-fold PLP-dependent enzyme [Acidobacteria bacterium]|nr:aminotransferase class V-fold PLP-dependent enzyme [Acidobacteriota bacterium]
MIYLDNNATTRIAPEVLEAMMPFMAEAYGNPSSAHALGRMAREAIERSRASVASFLGAAVPAEIVFTSGGTEGDNWAITAGLEMFPGRDHIVITNVEHEAVRNLCAQLEPKGIRVTRAEVDADGLIDPERIAAAVTPRTAVVSIMHANNETGVIFPVKEIAALVKARSDAHFHVDGVNAAGKVPIDLKSTAIDTYAISGHKFHAPKGIGAVYIRSGARLSPWFAGGGQEGGRRPGTEAVHQIVGLGAAADLAGDLSAMGPVRSLRDRLESGILKQIPNSRLNGTSDPAKRLPNTSNISFENTNGEAILARLDDLGICVSTGSACASAGHTASPVLQAMNIPYSYAMGSIRFSLSRYTVQEDVVTLLDTLPRIVKELRGLAE